MSSKVKIKINGREVEAESWMTVMQAAEACGIHIPHLCYHPGLRPVATCRLCVVKIEGVPKLQTACSTKVSEGMVVWTETEEVRKARADALEFLLINHPLDCPRCEKAGECLLQDYSFFYGKGKGRFRERKRDFGGRDISSKITLRPNRCVLCTRCVRYAEEVIKTGGLTVVERGGRAHIAVYPEGGFEGDYTLNVTSLCPVGALIPIDWRFKARPVYLRVASSICPLCSRGCNVYLDVKGIEPVRVRPRENRKVNYFYLCDYGYYAYKHFLPSKRELYFLERKDGLKRAIPERVFSSISDFLFRHLSHTGICLSPFLSNEEMIALKEFGNLLKVSSFYFIPPEYVREHENSWLMKPEKAPNMEGLRKILPEAREFSLAKEKVLFVAGDIMRELSLPGEVERIVLFSSSIPEGWKDKIEFFVPLAGWAERNGTWTNFEGRVQWFESAIEPVGDSMRVMDFLSEISGKMGVGFPFRSAKDVIPLLKRFFPDAPVEEEMKGSVRKTGVR